MIIDSDTHIAPTGGEFDIARHIARLDANEIDAALTWLKPDYSGSEIEGHNRYVYDAWRKHPDRIIPFGWTDPTVSVEHAKKMIQVCLDEYGFIGVKMNGAQNNYFIDDPVIGLPIAEAIAKAGGMIAYHIGPDAYEKTHPLRAAEIARRFRETTVLMVHMGMTDGMMNEAAIRVAESYSNVYLIASATTPNLTRKAIARVGAERVLFGSDSPFSSAEVEIAAHRTLLKTFFSSIEYDLVMSGNAARIFKRDPETGAAL